MSERFNNYNRQFQNVQLCQVLLQDYLLVLVEDPETNEPFPMLFRDNNCSSSQHRFPNSSTQLQSAYTRFTNIGFALSSLYVPFNQRVQLRNSEGSIQTINGPAIAFTTTGITIPNPTEVLFSAQQPWDTYLSNFCFGIQYSIGNQSILDYQGPIGQTFPFRPQQPACDNFMQSTFCINDPNNPFSTTVACGCFRDQEQLKTQFPSLTLPVTCFGQTCEHGGYKTAEMLTNECSPAVCGNIVREEAGQIIDSGVTEIYCNSNFYIVTTVNPTTNPTDNPPEEQSTGLSITGGILIGVALLVLGGLVAGIVVTVKKRQGTRPT